MGSCLWYFCSPTTKGGQIRRSACCGICIAWVKFTMWAWHYPSSTEGSGPSSEYAPARIRSPIMCLSKTSPAFAGRVCKPVFAAAAWQWAGFNRADARETSSDTGGAGIPWDRLRLPRFRPSNIPDLSCAILFQHNVETNDLGAPS